MTEHPGGQPHGESLQFPTLRNAGAYRRIIEIIEYSLDSNPPGHFTRLALTQLRDEVNNTIVCVRSSQDHYKSQKIVLENLRKARISLQLAIDEYDKKAKLYNHIETARQRLEESLCAW